MHQREGYITDVGFDAHFWREMAPTQISFVAALHGCSAPDPEQAFHYVELGCGQGIVTNLLAAAYPHARFTGIDLNPSHIVNARHMADEAELTNVTFREESFLDSAEADDATIATADYIGINSIISWVPREAFDAILQFISRKLRSGGIVYISYNAMPGWADLHPVRQIFYEHAKRQYGNSEDCMRNAINFADQLREKNMQYFRQNPNVPTRMNEVFANDPHHMVHEYLNDTWRTFYVTEVAEALSEAALGFLASADPLENAAEYYVTPETKELIDAAPDRLMAEFLKDLACNQWYRRDLFIRGTRQLTTEGKEEQIEQFSFVAVAQASVSSEIFQTMLGDAKVPLESWSPIVNFLGATPRTFGEIVDATGQDPESVLQALAALVSGGVVHPVLPTVDVAAAKRFNRVVANRARLGEPYRHIAYPRAGTAFPAEDVESNALTLIQDGEARDVESLKNALWTIFGARGRHAIRFGGVLQHMDVTFDDLAAWARHIWEHRVPVWRSQGLLQGDGDSVG